VIDKRLLLLVVVAACSSGDTPGERPASNGGPRGFEPPVATNPETPVEYPIQLFDRQIEGTVVLRIFVDETGTVVPDSTRIAEGSGHPAMDSAALAGVSQMQFAPARNNGIPVATAFLQPVHFRHPDRESLGGEP
jgi:TonB family protein